MKWLWNDDEVNAKLATENVANVLVNKLRRLKEKSQYILKIASCLGASFNDSILNTVVTKLPADSDCDDTSSELSGSIQEIHEEGLWERGVSEDSWQFGHDKLQAAAFDLIAPERRDSLRGEIGGILMKELGPDNLDENIFSVVSLCNYKSSYSPAECKEMAKMNLAAGLKVRRLHNLICLFFLLG